MRQPLTFIAVAMMLLVAACSSRPVVHEDGEGPLTWTGDPQGMVETTVDRPPDDQQATFGGLVLCVEDSGRPARISGIDPIGPAGDPLEIVGTRLRTLGPTDTGIGSLLGYDPTSWSTTGEDAIGAEVIDECRPRDENYQELVIGLRATADGAGAWEGVAITYTYEGETYVVHLRNRVAICAVGDSGGCREIFG